MTNEVNPLEIDNDLVVTLSRTLHETCSDALRDELTKGHNAGAAALGILFCLSRTSGTIIAGAGGDESLLEFVVNAIMVQIDFARKTYGSS